MRETLLMSFTKGYAESNLYSGKSSTVAKLLSSVNISSGKIYTNSGKSTLAVGMNMTLAVGKYSSSGNEQDRFVSDAILFNNYWKDQLRRTIILEDVQTHKGLTASLVHMRFKVVVRVIDDTGSSSLLLFDDLVSISPMANNAINSSKSMDGVGDLQTPVLDTAKSSRFSNVANIPFNIEESPKTTDGTAKGNGTNANGKGSYKETENYGGDSRSGKRTIIDLDDFDEEASIAKRNKKVIQVQLEPKD
ncbi:hypothetical protein Tco_1270928 [Tanacetum coccineum]